MLACRHSSMTHASKDGLVTHGRSRISVIEIFIHAPCVKFARLPPHLGNDKAVLEIFEPSITWTKSQRNSSTALLPNFSHTCKSKTTELFLRNLTLNCSVRFVRHHGRPLSSQPKGTRGLVELNHKKVHFIEILNLLPHLYY